MEFAVEDVQVRAHLPQRRRRPELGASLPPGFFAGEGNRNWPSGSGSIGQEQKGGENVRLEYSPINDLYGVEPMRRRREQGSSAWLVIGIVLAGAFLYESIRPVKRLRAEPPSDFVAVSASIGPAKVKSQEHVARSYWDMAVEFLQDNYPFGSSLPSSPPSDFKLQNASESGGRILYWEKLRQVWKRPEAWNTSFEWNMDWLSNAFNSFEGVWNEYVHP